MGTAGGATVTQFQSDAARVRRIHFLGTAECDRLVAHGQRSDGWRDATVFQADDRMLIEDEQRQARIIGEGDGGGPSLDAALRSVRVMIEALPIVRTSGLTLSPIQLIRYPCGGFYRTHRDGYPGHSAWRKLSFVVYLNDDFAGGCTVFPELDLSVQPQQGYALVFPPHYAHRAEAVTEGEKFILSFWLEDHRGHHG